MLEALQWRRQFLGRVNERFQIGVINLPRDEPVMTASLPSRGLGVYMMRGYPDILSTEKRCEVVSQVGLRFCSEDKIQGCVANSVVDQVRASKSK